MRKTHGWFIKSEQQADGSWNTKSMKTGWEDLQTSSQKWQSIWYTLTMERERDLKYGIELVKRVLREDRNEPIPPEGKALLAELIDSKKRLLDVTLDVRTTNRGTSSQKRHRSEFETAKKIMERVALGMSKAAAIKDVCPEKNSSRVATEAYRGRFPWAPWEE